MHGAAEALPGTGEILGGEDRIDSTLFESCGDSLIVNLGSDEWENVRLLISSMHVDFRLTAVLRNQALSLVYSAIGTCMSETY